MDFSRIFAYDIETYPNVFTVGFVNMATDQRWLFEITERTNDSAALALFLTQLRDSGSSMLGFNNESFDYPVIHEFWSIFNQRGIVTAEDTYRKAAAIIEGSDRWGHMVWPSDRLVPQIDVFKIMHFDNPARSTSLKKLEINMRSGMVEDLPYKPGVPLTLEQLPPLIAYMCHDIAQTAKFARLIEGHMDFRATITTMDATNYNDTKIGKQFFISELEKTGVACFTRVNGRRQPRQTPRTEGIRVADRLLNVPVQSDELKRMWHFFHDAVIPPSETKGFFTDLSATVGDFTIHFGAGGIHGSVANHTFRSTPDRAIIDLDVTSYYPSLAIANGWFPEHLSETFCKVYAELKERRVSFKKGTPDNAMLKLALNGVYGDSNNKYSPFYDPAYTMAITINGQMLLAWLAETIVAQVAGVELVQVNTDGLTVSVPRTQLDALDAVRRSWEDATRLTLEDVEYDLMAIRDVNGYVARSTSGKIKRKGAYAFDLAWHQDHSSLVVPKAVSAWLFDGTDPAQFIYSHTDPFDFMRHIKVPRSSRLMHGDQQVQNASRYYIALSGEPLVKVMPPLAKNPGVERHIGIDVGWKTRMCNRAEQFDWTNLNRRWYLNEARKLIAGLG